jgi:putative Holliday junction resolvase
LARILALDVGEKTIGVAISDESETFAFPQKTILRQEGHKRDMATLRNVIEEQGVEEIVIGLPVMMNGTRGIQAEKAEEFATLLRRYTHLPIHMQDERLSTSEADKLLIEADRRRSERKQAVDSMAASLILQTFMDKRRGGVSR